MTLEPISPLWCIIVYLEFMVAPSTSSRKAFLEDFARIAVDAVQHPLSPKQEVDDGRKDNPRLPPSIVLTVGLRFRTQFSSVPPRKHAHLLGIARLATLQPHLPRFLLSAAVSSRSSLSLSHEASWSDLESWLCTGKPLTPRTKAPSWWSSIVGAGIGIAWHNTAMRRIEGTGRQIVERELRAVIFACLGWCVMRRKFTTKTHHSTWFYQYQLVLIAFFWTSFWAPRADQTTRTCSF